MGSDTRSLLDDQDLPAMEKRRTGISEDNLVTDLEMALGGLRRIVSHIKSEDDQASVSAVSKKTSIMKSAVEICI